MSGGGGGAVRAVKSQCGGAAARWRKRACEWEEVGRGASMGPAHLGLDVGWYKDADVLLSSENQNLGFRTSFPFLTLNRGINDGLQHPF